MYLYVYGQFHLLAGTDNDEWVKWRNMLMLLKMQTKWKRPRPYVFLKVELFTRHGARNWKAGEAQKMPV